MVHLTSSTFFLTLTSLLTLTSTTTTFQPVHAHALNSNAHSAAAAGRHAHPHPARYASEIDAVKRSAGARQAEVESKRRRKVLRRATRSRHNDLAQRDSVGEGEGEGGSGSKRMVRRDASGGAVCVIKSGSGNVTTTMSTGAIASASATANGTYGTNSTTSAGQVQVTTTAVSSSASSASISTSLGTTGITSSSSDPVTSSSTSSYVAATSAYTSSSYAVSSSITASSTSAATTASSTATTTTTTSASTSTTTSSLTPNNNKAGVAGGDSLPWIASELGWWYDWSADPTSSSSGDALGVVMLWGDGQDGTTDASRLATFEAITTTPAYIIGYEEPDCPAGSGSAGFSYQTGATLWNSVVGPWAAKGSVLLSPSMCHQASESGWLAPFEALIDVPWAVTNLHINKNSMNGVNQDLDHYWDTYGKPMWVTEFACVDDSDDQFIPCTDQSEIDTFISDIVALFEADSRVYAYAYSDGEGLGSVWPTVSNGALSASGKAYLAALQAR